MKSQLSLSIYSSIHLVTSMATTISGHTTPKFFYQLLISGINMQKSRLIHYFVLEQAVLQALLPTAVFSSKIEFFYCLLSQ